MLLAIKPQIVPRMYVPLDDPIRAHEFRDTTSAPKSRHNRRNGDSLTPAWGARKSGVPPLRKSVFTLQEEPVIMTESYPRRREA